MSFESVCREFGIGEIDSVDVIKSGNIKIIP